MINVIHFASLTMLISLASVLMLTSVEQGDHVKIPANALHYELFSKDTFTVGEPVQVGYILRNTTERDIYVLIMSRDLFKITKDGTSIPYRGPVVKRGPPTADEYILIKGKSEDVTRVNLAENYDLSKPGEYRIACMLTLNDATFDGDSLPSKVFHRYPVLGNVITIKIIAAQGEKAPVEQPVSIVNNPIGEKTEVVSSEGKLFLNYDLASTIAKAASTKWSCLCEVQQEISINNKKYTVYGDMSSQNGNQLIEHAGNYYLISKKLIVSKENALPDNKSVK